MVEKLLINIWPRLAVVDRYRAHSLRLEGQDTPVELQVETASEFAALAAVLERKTVFHDKELGIVRSAE